MNKIEPLESRVAPASIFALASNGTLLHFDSESPSTVDAVTITGLGANQSLRGIDFRPATGELYAVAATTGSASNSIAFTYVIDPITGAAEFVGQTAAAIAGFADVAAGFDFNPTVDRMRVVNTNDENFRVNPVSGALAANDTDLTPAATSSIIAEAYDRNFTGGTATTRSTATRGRGCSGSPRTSSHGRSAPSRGATGRWPGPADRTSRAFAAPSTG